MFALFGDGTVRLHTHYDNLKVSRDAPIEVIRAAYKSLAGKYHPDLHSGSEKAARIMRIINASYEVLSDPNSRRLHDDWIARREAEPSEARQPSPEAPEPAAKDHAHSSRAPSAEPNLYTSSGSRETRSSPLRIVVGAAIAAVLLSVPSLFVEPKNPPTSRSAPAEPPIVTADQVAYIRPAHAPNGAPWPSESGYIDGYEQEDRGGLSNLTIDGRQNASDKFIKLFDLRTDRSRPVRFLYVRAFTSFTIEKLRPGTYDIRLLDLDSGGLSRSDTLAFTETRINHEVHWRDITVTLYGVLDAQHPIHFETITPDQF
jgi:curved DNA-binding protein CbpA